MAKKCRRKTTTTTKTKKEQNKNTLGKYWRYCYLFLMLLFQSACSHIHIGRDTILAKGIFNSYFYSSQCCQCIVFPQGTTTASMSTMPLNAH